MLLRKAQFLKERPRDTFARVVLLESPLLIDRY